MKQILLLILALIFSFVVNAAKIQQQGIKSAADCTGAGATLANCLPLDSQIYVSANGINQQLSSAITSGLIGGSVDGTKNYISNSTFESSSVGVTGYNLYNDGVVAVPVDGTGGSVSNLTITRNTTTPLFGTGDFLFTKSGSASTQGEGFSTDFTIDVGAKSNIQRLTFYYTTSANYADGDITVYLYDVTNASLIQCADGRIFGGTNKAWSCEFQTTSNSTSYRMIWHVASANAQNYTFEMDNVFFGSKPVVKGPIVTDWKVYTATLTNLGNATQVLEWRRVGDTLELRGRITIGSTLPTGTISVSVPLGLIISSGYFMGFATASHTTGFPIGTAYNASSTDISFLTQNSNSVWNATNPITWVAADYFDININHLKITGWSSNQTLSEDVGNRQIVASVYRNAALSQTSSGAFQDIVFDSIYKDTTGAYNTSTGVVTIPESGFYDGNTTITFTNSATGIRRIQILDNNANVWGFSQDLVPQATYSSVISSQFTGVYFQKGQTLKVQGFQTSGGSLAYGPESYIFMRFEVSKRSSPQQIAASEKVYFFATNTSGQSIPSSTETIVTGWSVQKDDHAMYNSGTGKIVAPRAGNLNCSLTLTFTSAFVPATQAYVSIRNETQGYSWFQLIPMSSSYRSGSTIPKILNVNLGDVLSFRIYHDNASSQALHVSNQTNSITCSME